MELEIREDDEERQILVKGAFNIYKCSKFKKDFLVHFNQMSPTDHKWRLNLKEVESFDIAALQALIAMKKEIEIVGGSLLVGETGKSVDEIMNLLGKDVGDILNS